MHVSRGPANRIKIPLALVHGGLNIQEQRGTPKLQRLSSRVSGVPSMNNRHLRYTRLGTGTCHFQIPGISTSSQLLMSLDH